MRACVHACMCACVNVSICARIYATLRYATLCYVMLAYYTKGYHLMQCQRVCLHTYTMQYALTCIGIRINGVHTIHIYIYIYTHTHIHIYVACNTSVDNNTPIEQDQHGGSSAFNRSIGVHATATGEKTTWQTQKCHCQTMRPDWKLVIVSVFIFVSSKQPI